MRGAHTASPARPRRRPQPNCQLTSALLERQSHQHITLTKDAFKKCPTSRPAASCKYLLPRPPPSPTRSPTSHCRVNSAHPSPAPSPARSPHLSLCSSKMRAGVCAYVCENVFECVCARVCVRGCEIKRESLCVHVCVCVCFVFVYSCFLYRLQIRIPLNRSIPVRLYVFHLLCIVLTSKPIIIILGKTRVQNISYLKWLERNQDVNQRQIILVDKDSSY